MDNSKKSTVELAEEYDQLHPDGKYVLPVGTPPRIRIREMDSYCKKVGKTPSELTEEEMQRFRY